MWYIVVTAMFINLSIPIHTVFLGSFFSDELSCNYFLNKNYSFLNDSLSQKFTSFIYEGKTYKLESTNFECKEYIPTTTS
tara:strand:+ start:406 stop:645 length:240 start_codon:yes stop_codon:yes gene_type:complete